MIARILLITALCATIKTNYTYSYQAYPDRVAHSHPFGHAGAYPTPYPNSTMQSLLMASLLNPAAYPLNTGTTNTNFQKAWNDHLGNDLVNNGAIQQNLSCRAECRRQAESPVCGSNMTRYFNECDAQCDQITYSTENLRYNDRCCCDEDDLSLAQGNLTCVLATANDFTNVSTRLIVNRCLANCLTQNGDSLAQGSDIVSPC